MVGSESSKQDCEGFYLQCVAASINKESYPEETWRVCLSRRYATKIGSICIALLSS